MNFSDVKDWTIYEGSVIRVTDSLNRVIWEKDSKSYYITATYYPTTNTTTSNILRKTNDTDYNTQVTLIEYNGTEYNPSSYLKFDKKNQNQTLKIYFNSPTVNVYEFFRGVEILKTIEIGKGITNVFKSGLFLGGDGYNQLWFRTATVESGNPVYDTRGGGVVNTATNTLVIGGSKTTIDSTIEVIGRCALGCVSYHDDGQTGNNGVTLWDIPGNTCTSLGEYAFWGTRKISRLNLRGYRLRQNQDIPANAFTSFGDNNSTIHIPTGTTLANTVWLNELVTTRQTGYKWTVCADL